VYPRSKSSHSLQTSRLTSRDRFPPRDGTGIKVRSLADRNGSSSGSHLARLSVKVLCVNRQRRTLAKEEETNLGCGVEGHSVVPDGQVVGFPAVPHLGVEVLDHKISHRPSG
jgi:hypothetical protein